MYRGPRPHRGAYSPAASSRGFAPRGPPAASAFPSAPYRHEHSRDNNGYQHGYRRHAENPPRRYSSPGRGSVEDFRADRPSPRDYGHQRYSPSPSHGALPADHSLVITVGNELTGLSQSTETPYARDYSPHRSSYEDHSSSRRHSQSHCRDRAWSRSPERINSRSRPRSKSRSRAVSCSRPLSRGRSRPRSRTRSRSRSRGRSRARSTCRPHSRSRSRSRGRSRCRSRSRGRSRGRSHSRGRSRARSRSCSGSSSSSSSSCSSNSDRQKEDFSELDKARRRKELEDMLTMPTKSILKKRIDSSETDSPIIAQSTDSSQGNSASGLSKDAEQLLCAVNKNMDSDLLASMLAQNSNAGAIEELMGKLQPTKESGHGFPLPHESSIQERSDLAQLLSVMAETVTQPPDKKKSFVDIEDEEKFLYGDEEEEDKFPAKEMAKSEELDENTGPDVLYPEAKTGVVHDLQRKDYEHSSGHGHLKEDESQMTKQSKYRDKHYSSALPGQHLDCEPQCNPTVPGSHDAQVKAEVEEYEKIQDLLKTIGLDLGVAEISKMAARTQERLQGKNPGKSTVRKHQYDRRRKSHSRSSSSTSRGSSCSRTSSHSSYERTSGHGKKKSAALERHSLRSASLRQREVQPGNKEEETPWSNTPTEVVNLGTNNYPAHSAHQMPPYPQPHTRGVIHPNYPPPGYNPYGSYIPYMPQAWPMYPPPRLPMPPQTPMNDYSSPTVDRRFLKVISTEANEAQKMDEKGSKVDPLQSITIACSGNHRRVTEEKNNAKQKQKVSEELEKLKKDRDSRKKKRDNLLKELESLRKQQGELLRKKRREKDGHKDPILMELGRLQEDVMAQISSLRTEHEAGEKKYEELVKVATILGLDHKNLRSSEEHECTPSHSKSKESRSPEKSKSASTTTSSQGTKSSAAGFSARLDSKAELFEYYDAGNHWCKNCNITSGSMFDFFTHLHSKMHRKTLDPYIRPWASGSEHEKPNPTGDLISKPAKGSEFVLPVRGFFCQLCKEFFGDPICAEAHVTCHKHNEKYKELMYENPLYEQRRNLDRQAGMEKKQTEHKRKHEDDSQDEQKNSKSSKDDVKKPKCKNEDEYRPKHIKEEEQKVNYFKEEEHKPKCKKEEVERTKSRKDEEERTRYTKEEGERNKFRKEDEERCRQKKGDEERYKPEEDKYRYREENLYKYKEDQEKYRYRNEEEKSRYRKGEDKKYKYGHEPQEGRRPRYREEEGSKVGKSIWLEDEEEEEERPKYGRKEDKKRQQKGWCKNEKEKPSLKDAKVDSEKPSELPKVYCGPSPAMLAKLRKKNDEATPRPAFGKFTWKKPEKTALEKEAEKIAEQFMKEDEESVVAKGATIDSDDQDAFAKSVAAAKSIAIKLLGKSIAPSQEWVAYNQVKVRPTLPTHSNVLRKSNIGLQNKPVSADTPSSAVPTSDASTKTSETVTKEPADKEGILSPDLISKEFVVEEVKMEMAGEEVKMEVAGDDSSSFTSASVSIPTTSNVTTPSPTVKEVEAVKVKAPSECMIKLESDVAAPGVPAEEHKLTIMVCPPPKLQSLNSHSSLKTDKPKTSLAAAKAKDLFDIFYGGSSTLASCSGSSAGNKVGFKQDSTADSGCLSITLNKESTKQQDQNSKHVDEVSGLKYEELSADRGAQAEPPTFDLEVEPLELKAEEHCGSMDMATVDCKNEADSFDCLTNSEIMENIEMIESNDDQNPLDTDEAMTLSFSPPPGSFTEHLNLDTFEFSFDSL